MLGPVMITWGYSYRHSYSYGAGEPGPCRGQDLVPARRRMRAPRTQGRVTISTGYSMTVGHTKIAYNESTAYPQ